MTSRGSEGLPKLPPKDPSLETRPARRGRRFTVRSYGPGVDYEASKITVSADELDKELADSGYETPGPMPESGTQDDLRHYFDKIEASLFREEMRNFLQNVEDDGQSNWQEIENPPIDPTWGLCVFVTSYTEPALEKLDRALSKLTEAVRRYFIRNRSPVSEAYGIELYRRFKLDVILDEEALQNASDDRVREEFNGHVRHLHFWPAKDKEPSELKHFLTKAEMSLNRPPGPNPRYTFCVALDEAKIVELSELEFPAGSDAEETTSDGIMIKLIYRNWTYPENPNEEHFYLDDEVMKYATGTYECPIGKIPLIYNRINFHDDVGEMFPMWNYEG